jgi:hypothetical protein
MNLTEEDVRRIVREEMGRDRSLSFEFGTRVKYAGTRNLSWEYEGVGVIVSALDSDGDYKVLFPSGEWTYFQPRDLVRA